MIAYMRVLRAMKCNSCNHEGYDVDFEKYDCIVKTETEELTEIENYINVNCPICNSTDVEFTEDNKIDDALYEG